MPLNSVFVAYGMDVVGAWGQHLLRPNLPSYVTLFPVAVNGEQRETGSFAQMHSDVGWGSGPGKPV